jgi:hypothetical protein
MGPDRRTAVFVESRSEAVEVARAEAVVPNILLARPNDLQGVGHLLGEANRLLDRVRLESAAESSSNEMIVYGHLRRKRRQARLQ